MKQIVYIFVALSILLFTSCNKNKLVPDDEVPQWLKEKIIKEEAIIDSAPKLMPNFGAWIRYKYEKEYYFEYDNPLSSFIYETYKFNGDSLNYQDEDLLNSYQNGKCCKRYVWKAPEYHELN